jgi:hypothetical protein
MLLSYTDIFSESRDRTTVKAEMTTEHPASSYGQPVLVLEDGGALDLSSWIFGDYRIEEATKEEEQAVESYLSRIGGF